jgi:hypothetical protein
VVLTGDIMTMPGLPKRPAAENIDVDDNGVISGSVLIKNAIMHYAKLLLTTRLIHD